MKIRNKVGYKFTLFSAIVGFGTLSSGWSQSMFDVFFLTDTTGSMGGLINGVQTSSTAILDAFSTNRDVLYGVGEYKDGNSDSFGFKYNLVNEGLPTLSSDRSAIIDAISQWGASGGGDTPEDNLFGLREVASSTPWRENARKIIFWFGDAVGLDPASDGTTLDATLAALSSNCVEVIAIDLNDLDGTGQATAITTATLACGRNGGKIVKLNLTGLSPADAAALILATLAETFEELAGDPGEDTTILVSSNLGASIVLSRTMTRDVGSRLSRLRAGLQSQGTTVTAAPATSAKGGMAKGGMAETTTFSAAPKWEAWGQFYYSDDNKDGQTRNVLGQRILVQADTDTEIAGASIGGEYRWGKGFTAGLAVSAADANVSAHDVGRSDIDSVALIPYLSYYRPTVFANADFYADALYAYSWNDYSSRRIGGLKGSTDGNSNQIEVNAGLNFRAAKVVHGPFAQFRWLDGEIEEYTERGTGGLSYDDADYKSVATQLGYQASFPIRVGAGTLVPQVSAAWEHEFEADQGSIAGLPLGELDEDVAVLSTGVGYYLDNGWNTSLNYEARLSDDNQNHYVGLKIGKEF